MFYFKILIFLVIYYLPFVMLNESEASILQFVY